MTDFINSDEQRAPAYRATDTGLAVRPNIGEIKMNNDLLPTIAIYAAVDTRGIVSLTGKYNARDFTSRKEIERGVSVTMDDNKVTVNIEVDIEFGHNLYDTCVRCQQQVKNAIEHMSGFVVERVNITVRGVVPQQNPPENRVATT